MHCALISLFSYGKFTTNSRAATVNSRFRTHGSVQVCIFSTINVDKTDILTGKSYKR